MIIGLTGRNAAGKGEAVEYLKTKGFYPYSLSDIIREEIASRGLKETRERMIEVGNELRERHGHDVLARRLLKKVDDERNFVVDSIRLPEEVQTLRDRADFVLLAIDADPAVRFERLRERGRRGDPTEREEFDRLDEIESAREGSGRQQLHSTISLADRRLHNNGPLDEFHGELASHLKHLMDQHVRPDWDEYFMRLAKVASLRSNCVKRRVAAIIVREHRVISTGYNGTPRGTKNCFEGGCPRCNALADSGTRLDECLCSHGEENAIVQAAFHGVSVKGSTLYTTFAPCLMCTKMIINAGISEVVYNLDYPLNDTSFALLQEAGVACRRHRVD